MKRVKPLYLLLGAGVAGLGLYALMRKPARFIGDKAQIGDDAVIPVTRLPAGALPALPQGAGLINIRVNGTTDATVNGFVTSYIIQELPNRTQVTLPQPIGPIVIPRSGITSVSRNNQLLTA